MTLYIYDGSLTGFLTVIFEIYDSKSEPSGIMPDGEYQVDFLSEQRFITADGEKAARVERSIAAKTGDEGFYHFIEAFCCGFEPENKDMKLYRFLRLLFAKGGKVAEMHNIPEVSDYDALAFKTGREIQRIQGFLRFKVLTNGMLFAEYAPDNDITHFLTPYFAGRNAENRFIIRDSAREIYGLYNGVEWTVLTGEGSLANAQSLVFAEEEIVFRDLWQQYYDTVSIASRRNTRLRAQFMPKRYWRYLTEYVED